MVGHPLVFSEYPEDGNEIIVFRNTHLRDIPATQSEIQKNIVGKFFQFFCCFIFVPISSFIFSLPVI